MSKHLCVVFLVWWSVSPLSAEEASPQFRRLDRNQDGKLTKEEFSSPLFERLDQNRDGIVTAAEDQAFIKRKGGTLRGGRPNRTVPDTVQSELDIPYANTDNPKQRLDLYLPKQPKQKQPLPVVVFIHGGGWQNGDKSGDWRTLEPLVSTGEYAGVSIGYRLSGEAIWPAQIHDCKAAIRWIKANAKQYNLNPERIGVTGTSAGGHLVAMLGTSGDVANLEGTLGGHTDQNSRAACVIDQYGPTELLAMGGRHDRPNSPESKLVGGAIQENQAAARAASPTSYVSANDPPIMIIHGTEDPAVPFSQSKILVAALSKAKVENVLIPVTGGGHGNFRSDEVPNRMKAFFDKYLLEREVEIDTTPIQAGGSQR